MYNQVPSYSYNPPQPTNAQKFENFVKKFLGPLRLFPLICIYSFLIVILGYVFFAWAIASSQKERNCIDTTCGEVTTTLRQSVYGLGVVCTIFGIISTIAMSMSIRCAAFTCVKNYKYTIRFSFLICYVIFTLTHIFGSRSFESNYDYIQNHMNQCGFGSSFDDCVGTSFKTYHDMTKGLYSLEIWWFVCSVILTVIMMLCLKFVCKKKKPEQQSLMSSEQQQ